MNKKIILIIALISSFSSYSSEIQEKIIKYEQQARSGNSLMQYKLGLINEFGIDSKKDKDLAVFWYKKAHKNGVLRATTRLGVIYYELENYNTSMEYIKIAMNKNEPLSIIYFGKNEKRLNKIESAEKAFKLAMTFDNPQAFYEYGLIEGDLKENYYLGYINTKISEIKGFTEAKEKNTEYKNNLSSKQLYSANDRIKRMLN